MNFNETYDLTKVGKMPADMSIFHAGGIYR